MYFLSSSLFLLGNLISVHVAALTLTHGTVHIALSTAVRAGEPGALAAVARAAHYVFSKRAALLDGRLEILISLLLDGLCVL